VNRAIATGSRAIGKVFIEQALCSGRAGSVWQVRSAAEFDGGNMDVKVRDDIFFHPRRRLTALLPLDPAGIRMESCSG